MIGAPKALRVVGRMIAVEGIDGAGKTTICNRILNHMQATGKQAILASPWDAFPWCREIRKLFLGTKSDDIADAERQMLAYAVRAAQLRNIVAPALAENKYVILDRFNATTYAYQCATAENRFLWADLNLNMPHNALPGLTLFIDTDPQTAYERISSRGLMKDAIEERGLEFQVACRERFFEAFELNYLSNPAAVTCRIYGNVDLDQVVEMCIDAIDTYINIIMTLDQSDREGRFLEWAQSQRRMLGFAREPGGAVVPNQA